MIKLPIEFYILQEPFGCYKYSNLEGIAYNNFIEAAQIKIETRVFHITLDVETNAHESTREVTDDFIDKMVFEAEGVDDLPEWIQGERPAECTAMRDSEQAEAAHAASFSTPSM